MSAITDLLRASPRGHIIADLDGCISNDVARRHFLEARNYYAYHELMIGDRLSNQPLIEKAKWYGHEFIIVTGRPERYRDWTRSWLESNGVPVSSIWMRDNDDVRSSVDIKREHAETIIHGCTANDVVCAPIMAIDDRDDIVAMYAESFSIPSFVIRCN